MCRFKHASKAKQVESVLTTTGQTFNNKQTWSFKLVFCRSKYTGYGSIKMERRVNYKIEEPNVVIHSGIVETGTGEIELHSSYMHI